MNNKEIEQLDARELSERLYTMPQGSIMDNMKWTKELPKEGWYWVRYMDVCFEVIEMHYFDSSILLEPENDICLKPGKLTYFRAEERLEFMDHDPSFYGPIEPPKFDNS